MSTKRAHTHNPELVPNPFIKKRNLEWSIEVPNGPSHDAASASDSNDDTNEPGAVSPPQRESRKPSASAVEAGRAKIEDHLGYFSSHLAKAALSPYPAGTPRLPVEGYRRLYEANSGSAKGAHFIIHQHDHPVAGTHYDLRLQINETSSASWAIMYGLPGDPNSKRLNRNATETRIHCLWSHLIETASHSTGSLLIWDTGTYTVLPRPGKHSRPADDYSQTSSSDEDDESPQPTEQQKVHQAFQDRRIRLRLHGARLPSNYVLNLRLTQDEDAAGRARGSRPAGKKRRRRGTAPGKGKKKKTTTRGRTASTDSGLSSSDSEQDLRNDGDDEATDIVDAPAEQVADKEEVSAMERELRELEDEEVRRTNAYTGAANSIGSVHQRRWYLSLDREACGFVRRRDRGLVVWEGRDGDGNEDKDKGADETRGDDGGRLKFPFYVRGSEVERSVITGRLGSEVLRDEGVVGYVGRKGWRPVLN